MNYLTPDEVRDRLPFVMSIRTLRAKLRTSGLAIEHRKQLALAEDLLPEFMETLKCSGSKSEPVRRTGKSTARARTPAKKSAPVRARLAEIRHERSSQGA